MTRLMSALFLLLAGLPALALAGGGHDDYGYRGYGETVRCESRDERQRYCPADTRGGVRLVDQYSRNACVLGRSWGFDRRGIWVAHGCRARFALGDRYGYDRGWDDGRGRDWDRDWDRGDRHGRGDAYLVRCESRDGRSRFCPLPHWAREVDIHRQRSDARCDYGYSWGFRRGGVWVDRGCRADFVVF